MNKEEFLKAIENVPKTDSINRISAYNSINVEDLANAVDRFKKIPTYDELLKENQKYKEVIEKLNDLLIIKKARCLNEDNYVLNVPDLDDILQVLKEVK